MVDATIRRVSSALALLSAGMIFVMMCAMCVDVANRLLTGSSIAGVYELVESLVVGAIFLGLAWAERRQEHVKVELVTRRLPVRVAAWVRVGGAVASVVVVGWMTYATSLRARRAVDVGEFRQGLVEFPLWPARAAVAVGLAALLAELLLTLRRRLLAARDPSNPAATSPPQS